MADDDQRADRHSDSIKPKRLVLRHFRNAEFFRECRHLGALRIDGFLEFVRSADIEELPGRAQPLFDRAIGPAPMSAAIRRRSSIGVSLGPNRPISPSIVSAGWPASCTVGTLGSVGARTVLVTASNLILPDWSCGRTIASADS